MAEKMKVKVILGSTREGRFGEKPAAWLMDELAKRDDVDAELLDLRDYEIPFFNEVETPSYKQKAYAHPSVVRWTAKIADGEAFIVIAPEYNRGYPAVLKNAFDYVYQEWNNKPIGFVSYGSVMGARSVEQLRLVSIELQMAPIRNAIHMPYDVVTAIGGGTPAHEVFAPFADRVTGLMDQLVWWGRVLKAGREKSA